MDVASVPVTVDTAAPEGATNVYVLGRERALLVDPAGRDPDLDSILADREVAHVAVTHHHPDHVGGVATYASEHDATVWCRYGRERAFADTAGIEPDRNFRDRTTLPADDPVIVRDTPGHAPEHVAFALNDRILTGDTAVASGSVVVGAPEGDMRAYLTSLRRLRAMAPLRLLPGHGPAIEDPQETCERLIRHRLDREAHVLASVRNGARAVDDIVDAAYDKDISSVRTLASATVEAHLEKLAVEACVEWDGERARPA